MQYAVTIFTLLLVFTGNWQHPLRAKENLASSFRLTNIGQEDIA